MILNLYVYVAQRSFQQTVGSQLIVADINPDFSLLACTLPYFALIAGFLDKSLQDVCASVNKDLFQFAAVMHMHAVSHQPPNLVVNLV